MERWFSIASGSFLSLFSFFCPGRWDGTLCDCALTFFSFFLSQLFFFSTNQFESLFIGSARERSVYFHLQNRKWWSNKNKRWNEKSVVSLFLLSVQASPWTFLKEEKFIGDSFLFKRKKEKENSHPHFAGNGHYYKVYIHTQIALL
jgi:hypothetical protein